MARVDDQIAGALILIDLAGVSVHAGVCAAHSELCKGLIGVQIERVIAGPRNLGFNQKRAPRRRVCGRTCTRGC